MFVSCSVFQGNCLIAVWRSRYAVFGYQLSTWPVFGVPPLRSNMRSNTGSLVIVDNSGHELSWLHDVQAAINASFEAECPTYGCASNSGGDPEITIVDPLVLEDLSCR